MKIIYQDLIKFFNNPPSKTLLSEKLFQLGHEHEIDGDIIDIEITPNRGDCLSLNGIARDLNIFFDVKNDLEIYEGEVRELNIEFENLSRDACSQISFLQIEVEDIDSTYKPYLENYFKKLGVNKNNFFTDISNYIAYEIGQPTHCYDSRKIDGKIIFEKKLCNQNFLTLMDSVINLSGENCVFSINNEIINLAGIMGGKSTACTKATRKTLIECAYFNPESIIGRSTKYNINSEAAYKFERGVDKSNQLFALRRFIAIVNDHSKIKSIGIATYNSEQLDDIELKKDVTKINKILGIDISDDEYSYYLEKLGFDCNDNVKAPSFRNDIRSENDLAEEVARLIGYNNINITPFNITTSEISSHEDYQLKLSSILIKKGFSEVINFPFCSNGASNSIKVLNPLDKNKSYLRTGLKESLINNLLFNERRQKDSIKLFEISNVYTGNNGIDESQRIGIIASGRQGHNYERFSKKINIDFLKELLSFSEELKISSFEEILRSDIKSKRKEKIFYTELELKDFYEFLDKVKMPQAKEGFVKYKEISDLPLSTRDFSFLIKESSSYESLVNYIKNIESRYLKESFMFDFYKDFNKKEIKVGYRFIFQSNSKTLSEKDINESIKKILSPILILEGVSIPGLDL
jgi:phenylalanyl-tRNA synthetase beta chain